MARLVRILVLLTVVCWPRGLVAQVMGINTISCGEVNLVVNGGFENASWYPYSVRRSRDTFPADNWYEQTAATVDIMRDYAECDTLHVFSVDPASQQCVDCHSGEYCLGIGLLNPLGWLEHISGRLLEPLETGILYEVSFWVRKHGGECSIVPKGLGVVIHADSILFEASELNHDRVRRYYGSYLKLFSENPIYADNEVLKFANDTMWHRQSFRYRASGGERFLTFGRFAYGEAEGDPSHKEVLQYFRKVNKKPFQERVMRLTL